jgi:beta-glucanase (GH16 family)
MRLSLCAVGSAFAFCLAALSGPVFAEETPSLPLIDFGAKDAESRLDAKAQKSEGQIELQIVDGAKAKALAVTVKPGPADYPGVAVKPEGPAWDLSAFGHVEARIVNTGAKKLGLNLRVDNAGDWRANPWNTEQIYLEPGAAGTVSVIFGYAYGRKPSYALKPGAVTNILLFTTKTNEQLSFRVESLVAAGPAGEKPPVDPNTVRVKPKDGVILGAGVSVDAAKQIEAKGTQASLVKTDDRPVLRVVFPAAKGEQWAALKPEIGRWNLCDACEVRVKVKNDGQTPVTPSIQVLSNGGPTDAVAAAAPLAPGAEAEIVVPFAAAVPGQGVPVSKPGFYGLQKGTGTTFTSDATAAVRVSAKQEGEAVLLVQAVLADAPPAQLPEWLGKRPPVEGDWVKTFDEEFEGTEVDQTKWNIYGPNWWDKASHWSKDNLIVGGGVAKLHFEKKRGFHNDNPKPKEKLTLSGLNESDYACGYLDTFGKWVQRYGYFEARVKLPTAPGLWPTFWMVPDRGVAAGPTWKRSDTGNGGMELDIMEHLTRWGPYRYNIAMHWDGYGKEHTSVGSDRNYVQADKDGFITSGMLWTPGSLVYYCNGKELLRWESPRISVVPAYFIIEMTTGGWDNNSVDDAQLPVDYLIDYVRVWQRKDLASEADGLKSAPKPEAPKGN